MMTTTLGSASQVLSTGWPQIWQSGSSGAHAVLIDTRRVVLHRHPVLQIASQRPRPRAGFKVIRVGVCLARHGGEAPY